MGEGNGIDQGGFGRLEGGFGGSGPFKSFRTAVQQVRQWFECLRH
jgi:hypothetical protein